jgi:hypothetical protein
MHSQLMHCSSVSIGLGMHVDVWRAAVVLVLLHVQRSRKLALFAAGTGTGYSIQPGVPAAAYSSAHAALS